MTGGTWRSSRLWRWLIGPVSESRPAPRATESFPGAEVPVSFGEELLAETSARARYRTAIRDLIGDLGRDRKRELVDRMLLRFAMWVVDLPASEGHLSPGPIGHLDRALRRTHGVAEALSASTLRLSHDPVEDARERPPWVYAGFLAALLHDTGRLLDVEVTSPDGREDWNPMLEPLAAFLARHGLRRTPKDRVRFLPERGPEGRRENLRAFQALIPTREGLAAAGRRLAWVTGAATAPGEVPPHVPDAAREIAALLRPRDGAEAMPSRAEALRNPPAPPGMEEATGAPAAAPAPPPPPPPPPVPAAPADRSPVPVALPREGLWGDLPPARREAFTAERLLYVLGRQILSGKLSARGDSAQVFIRPEVVWFASPAAFEVLARSEGFRWRPDLHPKMLALLARAGALQPFGPERFLALVRTAPGPAGTRKAFRVPKGAFPDEFARAELDLWPREIEILEPVGEGGAA